MGFYGSEKTQVSYKGDSSPVTDADQASNDHILAYLEAHSPYPVVSEEGEDLPDGSELESFWLLDPLDGTKHFLKEDGEFVISLALIHREQAYAGFLYAPVSKEYYFAQKSKGCFFNGQKVENKNQGPAKRSFSSGYHKREESKEFREQLGIEEFFRLGSALKYGRMARGAVDIYPRFGETHEWDIAAGQIILEEAGCELWDIQTLKPMRYAKANYLNRGFVAFRRNLQIKDLMQSLIEKRKRAMREKNNG